MKSMELILLNNGACLMDVPNSTCLGEVKSSLKKYKELPFDDYFVVNSIGDFLNFSVRPSQKLEELKSSKVFLILKPSQEIADFRPNADYQFNAIHFENLANKLASDIDLLEANTTFTNECDSFIVNNKKI